MKYSLIVIVALFGLVAAQTKVPKRQIPAFFGPTPTPLPYNDGRYVLPYAVQAQRAYDDGQYRPDGSGLYEPELLGRYVNPAPIFGGFRGVGPTPVPVVRPQFLVPSPAPVYAPRYQATSEGGWAILRQEKQESEDGYRYAYETENQINAEEQGQLVNKGTDAESLRATGFYEYVGDDGQKYRVDYIADENGFQPQGAHLPTPPPIPEEIQRSLAYRGLL